MEAHNFRPDAETVLSRAASDFKNLQLEREKDALPWAEKPGKHSVSFFFTGTEAIFMITPAITHAEVSRLPIPVYAPVKVEIDDTRANLFYDQLPFDNHWVEPSDHIDAIYQELGLPRRT